MECSYASIDVEKKEGLYRGTHIYFKNHNYTYAYACI